MSSKKSLLGKKPFLSLVTFLEKISHENTGAIILEGHKIIYTNRRFREFISTIPLKDLEQKIVLIDEDGIQLVILLFFQNL